MDNSMKAFAQSSCIRLVVASVAMGIAAMAMAQTAPPRTVPLPAVTGPIATSPTSRIYNSAADARMPLDLSKYGYVEEEYFFSGKANVYDWAKNGSVSVHTANAPYNSRMLIRRPVDPKKFSGTVWVEFLNPVGMTDMSLAWGYSNYYMLDHGDAYIGVTAFGDSLKTLKRFNAERYGSLSMANPAPLPQGCKEAGKDYSAEFEDGMRWDMLNQVSASLKSNVAGRPLASLKVDKVYLFGQSNGDLPTYINAFDRMAKLANDKPVFDGYLLKDSGVPIATRQCDPRPAGNDPRRLFKNISVPFIQIVVENSVLANNNLFTRRADSDTPGDYYRRYEIPGSSHVDDAAFAWLPKAEIFTAVGVDPQWPETRLCVPRQILTDFPVHYYVSGAMFNLDQWARNGTAPPHAEFIQVNGLGTDKPSIARDQYGNALGGVRNAWVDVPNAAYNQRGACGNTAAKKAFGWDRLEAIYGNYQNYAQKFSAAVDRDVQQRWVPAAYSQRMKAGITAMPTTDR